MIYGCDGLESRIADLTGREVDRLLPFHGGYTDACRRIVKFRDGNTAFAKCATDQRTSGWLHAEISICRQLSGDFMAAVLAWDEEEPPLLVLEDLTENAWPPPWTPSGVDMVLDSLAMIHESQASVPEYHEIFTHRGWHEVAVHPEAFLSIRVASESWLTTCLPTLLEAHDRVEPEGKALVHLDVRSDNICFRAARAVLIDLEQRLLWQSRSRHCLLAAQPSPRGRAASTGYSCGRRSPGVVRYGVSGFTCRVAGPAPYTVGSQTAEGAAECRSSVDGSGTWTSRTGHDRKMRDIMPFLDRLSYGDQVPADAEATRTEWRRDVESKQMEGADCSA